MQAGGRLVNPTLFLAAFGATLYASVLVTLLVLDTTVAIPEDVSCILLGSVPVFLAAVGGALAVCVLNLGFAFLGLAAGAALGQIAYQALCSDSEQGSVPFLRLARAV